MVNLFSKLSTEYFENFFIVSFYLLMGYTVRIKFLAYAGNKREKKYFFQKRWFVDMEITFILIGTVTYIILIVFMTIFGNEYCLFMYLMGAFGMIPIFILFAWVMITNFKFSGMPILENDCYKLYQNSSRNLLKWCIGRCIKSIITIFLAHYEFNNPKNFSFSACVLCLLSGLIGEVFPLFVIIDVKILTALFERSSIEVGINEAFVRRVSGDASHGSDCNQSLTDSAIDKRNNIGHKLINHSN